MAINIFRFAVAIMHFANFGCKIGPDIPTFRLYLALQLAKLRNRLAKRGLCCGGL